MGCYLIIYSEIINKLHNRLVFVLLYSLFFHYKFSYDACWEFKLVQKLTLIKNFSNYSKIKIWKNNFQPIVILKIEQSFSGGTTVARLAKGDWEKKKKLVLQMLRVFRWGIRESELAQELGWKRRTVNNYLRALAQEDKAYREGRSWFGSK